MPLDGFTTALLARDIGNRIVGGRIDRVNQPQAQEIILGIHKEGVNHQLLLSANPGNPAFCLLQARRENPKLAPAFCMLLRKHLLAARILEFYSDGLERCLHLRIQQRNELGDLTEKTLILEIMGRHSNLILVNSEGRILDAVVHVDSQLSRAREVLPAHPYVAPPAQEKKQPEELAEEMKDALAWRAVEQTKNPEIKLKDWLLDHLKGCSPWMAGGLVAWLGLEAQASWASLDTDCINKLREFLLNWKASPLPAAAYRDQASGKLEFHAYALPHAGWICQEVQTLSPVIEEGLETAGKLSRLKNMRSRLEGFCRNRLKLLQKKEKVLTKEYEGAKDYEEDKKRGELLLAHLHLLKPGDTELTVQDYYEEDTPELTIRLFPNRSGSQSAQIYFKQYSKKLKRLTSAEGFLEACREEIAYLKDLLSQLEAAATPEDLESLEEEMQASELLPKKQRERIVSNRHNPALHPGKPGKKKKKQPAAAGNKRGKVAEPQTAQGPHRFRTPAGLRIAVGRNNLQNDQLTLRQAAPSDLWFHRKNAPGTHVILFTDKQEADEQSIELAARLCAWYSLPATAKEQLRALSSLGENQGERVEVDYCPAKNVWKPKGAKPGRVLYDGYRTLFVTPLAPECLPETAPADGQSSL